MNKNSTHNDDINKLMTSGAQIEWNNSKEDIWAKMQPLMEQKKSKRIFLTQQYGYAAAAGIAVIFGLLTFLSQFKTTVQVPVSERKTIYLPDQSKVILNAQTSLSYKPYWWFAQRAVKLEGEAYFEVTKGKKFEVISENAKTTVLGTSFNIFAREKQYFVTCFSGKVEVSSLRSENCKIRIKKGQQVFLKNDSILNAQGNFSVKEVNAWIENKFAFENQSINEVFAEIERQFGIQIHVPKDLQMHYSGNFEKTEMPETTLNIVCKPLGLVYKKIKPNEYQILESP